MPIYPAQLPESIISDPKRSAELKIYNTLSETLSDDCSVIYSAEWICKRTRLTQQNLFDPVTGEELRDMASLGEVDFIILTGRGLLVLEVKGGEVGAEYNTWYSIDREGTYHNIEYPLSQARRNMFAVLDILNKGRWFHNRYINLGYAAILPHTDTWQPEIQYQNLFIFKEQIHENLTDKFSEVLGFWEHAWKKKAREPEKLSESDIKEIIKIFAPTTTVRKPKIRHNIEEFQEQLLELTEKQFDILKCLAGNRKAVITGGAGTGKTLLAMEKAKQMALQGNRTLFTCPNRLLSKYVRNQLENIDNLEVMNFHELCYKWGKKAGYDNLTDPDGPDRYNLTAHDYSTVYPEILVDASDKLTDRFDAVIVDEAQDMKEEYWTALELCQIEESVFYIFCDPNQSIWHIMDDLPFNSPTFNLHTNLRNSKKVFEALKVLCYDTDYDNGCSDEGEFEIISLNNVDDIENKLTRLLTKLTKQDLSRRDITIITGKSRDSSFLAGKEAIGDFALTNDLYDTADKVLFSSARQYRGMESLALIMIEVDYIVDLNKLSKELGPRFEFGDNEQLLQQTARETLLIGMSRAQHSLYILADNETAEKLKNMGL